MAALSRMCLPLQRNMSDVETLSTKVDSLLAHKLKAFTHLKVITKVLLLKSK